LVTLSRSYVAPKTRAFMETALMTFRDVDVIR
jgi:hypothetical protein